MSNAHSTSAGRMPRGIQQKIGAASRNRNNAMAKARKAKAADWSSDRQKKDIIGIYVCRARFANKQMLKWRLWANENRAVQR